MKAILFAGLGLLVGLCASSFANAEDYYQPVYDDLEAFSRAFDPDLELVDLAAAFELDYFDSGSPGLAEYARRFALTPESLASRVLNDPLFFASLEDLGERLETQRPAMDAAFARLLDFHPDATFLPVYFLVSGLSSGGQASQQGLLISADRFALTDEWVDSELYRDRRLRPLSEITHLVAHELAHIQQALTQGMDRYRSIYGPDKSVLALAIREGTADFIAKLISGDHINPVAHEYGLAHEEAIWNEFKKDYTNSETGEWFFVKPTGHEEWPQDIGYFVGFRIVQSYYENAEDKSEAFQEILAVTDYELFLQKSGYAERFGDLQ